MLCPFGHFSAFLEIWPIILGTRRIFLFFLIVNFLLVSEKPQVSSSRRVALEGKWKTTIHDDQKAGSKYSNAHFDTCCISTVTTKKLEHVFPRPLASNDVLPSVLGAVSSQSPVVSSASSAHHRRGRPLHAASHAAQPDHNSAGERFFSLFLSPTQFQISDCICHVWTDSLALIMWWWRWGEFPVFLL